MAITPERIHGVLAKIESTYGTDAAPVAGTDGVQSIEPLHSNVNVEHEFMNRRISASGGILPIAPTARTGRKANIQIAWDARGSGAAYSATVLPEADPLLRSCGLARTDDFTVSSENVTYNQASTNHDSCTIWAYTANKLIKIVGCRGTMTWPVEAGLFGRFVFNMQGLVTAAPTEIATPTITFDSTIPPTAVGMSLTVGSWSPDVVSCEFASGDEVVLLPSANGSDGIATFEISAADPTWTLQAKTPALSDLDAYAVAKAATVQTISQTLGSVQYNKVKLDSTGAYLENPGHESQDSFAGWNLEFQLIQWDLLFN